MRVGILTLHDSVNYGAILQAYALRSFLTSLGHDVFLIDRRRNAQCTLRGPVPGPDRFPSHGPFSLDARTGEREYAHRCERTLAFLRESVGLSPYCFSDWRKAPEDLGVDALVVGSDQVWNANNHDPADYMLGTLPRKVRGIAYAASIGMRSLPTDRLADYRRGLAGFTAIGMREREGVEIVRGLGFPAEQVVDPVLLAGPDIWRRILATSSADSCGPRVVCYFLAEDFAGMVPALSAFSGRCGRAVDFFVDRFWLRQPKTFSQFRRNRRFWRSCAEAGVRFRLDAGPIGFVRALTAADAVVTNSYHALMFSLLFGKEVRVVLPTHPRRQLMNARLTEACRDFVEGPAVSAGLDAALASLSAGERTRVRGAAVESAARQSAQWLSRALASASNMV